MATTAKEVVEEIKEVELEVLEREEGSVIVKVDGWRMRVYFDALDKDSIPNKILVHYTGDIENAHSVKFEKLK
jgi:plastocyanin domain-containing protein